MISFATVVERTFTGPICTERDFELGIFVPNLRKVVEKYGIKYDPQNPIPADSAYRERSNIVKSLYMTSSSGYL